MLRRAVREFTWPFDLYATRVDPLPLLPEASWAMARRHPNREPEMPSLCAICAVVLSGKAIRTLFVMNGVCLDQTLADQTANPLRLGSG